MHELSIAVNLVEIADQAASNAGLTHVTTVTCVSASFPALSPTPCCSATTLRPRVHGLEGSRLEIQETPVIVFCSQCQADYPLPDIQLFRCPACGTLRSLSPPARRSRSCQSKVRNDRTHRRRSPGGVEQERRIGRGAAPTLWRSRRHGAQSGLQPRRRQDRPAGTHVGRFARARPAGRRPRRRSGDRKRRPPAGAQRAPVRQIVTAGICHLEAEMVAAHLAGWDLAELDFLFIENVGNLVCPSGYDLGEDARVVLLSTTEGEDKPLKYPPMFHSAHLAVLTKIDLAEAVEFDRAAAYAAIHAVRPGMPILETSARTGQGIDAWLAWLEALTISPAVPSPA